MGFQRQTMTARKNEAKSLEELTAELNELGKRTRKDLLALKLTSKNIKERMHALERITLTTHDLRNAAKEVLKDLRSFYFNIMLPENIDEEADRSITKSAVTKTYY